MILWPGTWLSATVRVRETSSSRHAEAHPLGLREAVVLAQVSVHFHAQRAAVFVPEPPRHGRNVHAAFDADRREKTAQIVVGNPFHSNLRCCMSHAVLAFKDGHDGCVRRFIRSFRSQFGQQHVGLVPDKNIGIIILTNETNVTAPNSLGAWVLDRILGNAKHDNVAESLKNAKANFEQTAKLFAKPSNPRPFSPLAPLAGKLVNPSFGEAKVTLQGDALVMEFLTSGAKFKLVPRDGDIFIASLLPTGLFGPIVDLDYMTRGFAQFQMNKDGKLNLLRLSLVDGQAYEFRRE
jgi:hypothetical protein